MIGELLRCLGVGKLRESNIIFSPSYYNCLCKNNSKIILILIFQYKINYFFTSIILMVNKKIMNKLMMI